MIDTSIPVKIQEELTDINTSQTSKLIKVAMTDMSIPVKIQEELTDIIVTTQRLQQGDRLAALLHFSTLKYVVRH